MFLFYFFALSFFLFKAFRGCERQIRIAKEKAKREKKRLFSRQKKPEPPPKNVNAPAPPSKEKRGEVSGLLSKMRKQKSDVEEKPAPPPTKPELPKLKPAEERKIQLEKAAVVNSQMKTVLSSTEKSPRQISPRSPRATETTDPADYRKNLRSAESPRETSPRKNTVERPSPPPTVSPRARAPTGNSPGVAQLPDSVRAALANRKK